MKAFFVKLVIFAGFLLGAVSIFLVFRRAGYFVLAVCLVAYFSVLAVAMAVILSYPRTSRQAVLHEFADELEARQKLVSTNFHARRAFRVANFADEGPHYFLELDDHSILHLCGTCLYDYEPAKDSLRQFPCTEFTVRRHARDGYVVDILCGGKVINPEIEAPSFSAEEITEHRVPDDGAILRGVSFNQLKSARSASGSSAA